jgi:hypothetical protein
MDRASSAGVQRSRRLRHSLQLAESRRIAQVMMTTQSTTNAATKSPKTSANAETSATIGPTYDVALQVRHVAPAPQTF